MRRAAARTASPPALIGRAISALDVTLARTDLWVPALAIFLLRGGLSVLLLPIVVLPSTVGVATFVGPTAIGPSGPSASFVRLVAAAGAVALGCLVASGLLAAWLERGLLRRLVVGPVEREPGRSEPIGIFAQARPIAAALEPAGPSGSPVAGTGSSDPSGSQPGAGSARGGLRETLGCFWLRAITLVPLGGAIAWVAPRVGAVGYAELVRPTDLSVPLPLRVAAADPSIVLIVLVGWAAAEMLGGIATRRHVLLGEGIGGSLAGSLLQLLRRPLATGSAFLLPLAASAAAIAGPLLVAFLSWGRLEGTLGSGRVDLVGIGFTGSLVLAWGSALVVAAAASAWRAIAWTAELLPLPPSGLGAGAIRSNADAEPPADGRAATLVLGD